MAAQVPGIRLVGDRRAGRVGQVDDRSRAVRCVRLADRRDRRLPVVGEPRTAGGPGSSPRSSRRCWPGAASAIRCATGPATSSARGSAAGRNWRGARSSSSKGSAPRGRRSADSLACRVWVDAPVFASACERGLARDGESHRELWQRYMTREQRFFAADRTPDRADVRSATRRSADPEERGSLQRWLRIASSPRAARVRRPRSAGRGSGRAWRAATPGLGRSRGRVRARP